MCRTDGGVSLERHVVFGLDYLARSGRLGERRVRVPYHDRVGSRRRRRAAHVFEQILRRWKWRCGRFFPVRLQLKANWEKPAAAPFPSSENLFKYMRSATPTSTSNPIVVGNPDAAFAEAARAGKVIEAEYDVPFQGHTAIGPAHATADPSNGQMTIYSNDMKSYGMRTGVATFLGMPRDRVRVVWMEGPQGFGRTAADDAGCEAAYLAREIGRPVRVQWMRNEETAWDTKAPAFAVKVKGGLDAEGNL